MSKELLQKVIDTGIDGNLSTFFSTASNYYSELEEDLSEFDEIDRFTDFQAIGELVFSPIEKIVVVTANVSGNLTERSGKKAQYEKAKKILKTFKRYDAGIFVFSDAVGNFRFSLVYGTADSTRLIWSNFRRFTYYVSKDHTNTTFKDRIGSCKFTDLDTIKNAFSVEKVTEAFYQKIANWYFWAVQNVSFPQDVELEENGKNNAVIRMITRLIFIWFMKERELVPSHLFKQDKISVQLKSLKQDETTYYKAILQNLFFATLNTKIENRKFRFKRSFQGKNDDYMDHGIYRYEDYFQNREDMLTIFKDIPFLNGGLFECLDWSAKESGTGMEVRFDGFSDKEVGLMVPNHLFFADEKEADLNIEYGTKNKKYYVEGLLNTLSAYNFTIDENDPNDQEVALDPELLGKVFENLLASFNPETATTARRSTGSYYTPREIVDFMVTKSLKQYYKSHLGYINDLDNKLDELLSPISGESLNPFGKNDSEQIVKLTEELRIVDPAVGSGAFPMGILNRLVTVLARVDHDNKLWEQAQLKVVEGITDPVLKQKLKEQINIQFREKNSNYGRKLYLIQRCIYGVDIQQIAIEIAKLRFFIALLVDEKIDKTKPNWGIEPLPNLDFKLMQGNSLISEFMGIQLDNDDDKSYGRLLKDETDELIAVFQDKKDHYQDEPDRTIKETLKHEIESLIIRIFESKLQVQRAEYFNKLKNVERKYSILPNLEQKNELIKKDTEILNKNFKFDLAAAEKQLKEFTTGQKVKPFFAWRLYFAEVFKEKSGFDLVIGNPPYIQLQKDAGKLADLYQNYGYQTFERTGDIYTLFYERGLNLLRDGGAICYITSNKWMRAGYGESLRRYFLTKNPCLLIDLGSGVFENATVDTNILLTQNIANLNHLFGLTLTAEAKHGDLNEYVKNHALPLPIMTEKTWFIGNNAEQQLKQKIERIGKPLKDWDVNIYRGVLTGLNEAFIIDTSTKDRLCEEDSKSAEILKPILRGKDIKRYTYEWAGMWLIASGSDINVPKLYPAIYRHLKKFEEDAKKRDDQGKNWWNLRACAYYPEFEKEKISWGNLALSGQYSLLDKGLYVNAPCPIITPASKYLLSILNSKVADYYIRNLGVTRSGGYFEYKPMFVEQLPIPIITNQNKIVIDKIESLTSQINADKKENPKANTSVLETQVDELVYQLYELTPEEIAVVGGNK
jgi:hypothetical protein